MNKISILTAIILCFFLISVVVSFPVVKADSNEGKKDDNLKNPLKRIWEVVKELREEIKNIWDSISGLQEQINNIELIPGPQGPSGQNGSQGSVGPQGPPGISQVRIAIFNITIQMHNGANISCNSDEFATGGGTQWFGDTGHPGILEFYPVNERTWHVKTSGSIDYGNVRLICAKYINNTL